MLYLILSICFSVSVGILIKISKKSNADVFQMISFNYLIAILCSYFLFDVNIEIKTHEVPYLPILALAILLPIVFVFLIKSIQQVGIIRTDLAQRLSLFLPIIAAILIFNETISVLKYIGILLGLSSIYLILNRNESTTTSKRVTNWLYPTLVFIGFGVIDILFKQLALYSTIPYIESMFYIFIGALIISILINLFYIIVQKRPFRYYSLLYGIPLGLINFLNIYFYLKAHRVFSETPTTVFAGMNFGVIILGTLIGYFFFNEKLSFKNCIGITLALVSVLIILITQFYNL